MRKTADQLVPGDWIVMNWGDGSDEFCVMRASESRVCLRHDDGFLTTETWRSKGEILEREFEYIGHSKKRLLAMLLRLPCINPYGPPVKEDK